MGRRFSAVVMTHPDRAHILPELDAALGERLPRVCDDDNLGVWGNGRRAMLSFDSSKSWHLVLQEDVIPCRDLLDGIDELLRYVPEDNPVSLYMGAPHRVVGENRYQQLSREGEEIGASFIILDGVIWGPALVLPTKHIEAMVQLGDRAGPHTKSYDGRIGQWCAKTKTSAWHTCPSLVGHRQDTPSLIGKKMGRNAFRFAGEECSALHDLRWDGPVIDKDNGVLRGYRAPYGKERAVVQEKDAEVKVERSPDAAWAIGDDAAIVTVASGVQYEITPEGLLTREKNGRVEKSKLLGASAVPGSDVYRRDQIIVGKRMALGVESGRIVYSGEVAEVVRGTEGTLRDADAVLLGPLPDGEEL